MAYTAINDPELYFQTKLYTGDGNSTQAITLDGSEDMQPDFVWIKNRTDAHWHNLNDSVRGVGAGEVLRTNNNGAEGGTSGHVSVIGSDGFTVAEGSGDAEEVNTSSDTYVAWNWKESVTAGFDIVLYTGNETARTIAHSLSAVPKMIIAKDRDANDNWNIYNATIGNDSHLHLNVNNAASGTSTYWQDTTPTSSVFYIGDGGEVNKSGNNFIAYCFADVQGFSKFGSYTGNGNADGAFVYTGFRPAFLLTKRTNSTAQWQILDNKRDTFNVCGDYLKMDGADATTSNDVIDFVSNGFKHRSSLGSWNPSGGSFIYMAFAEAPFVNSKGVPANAR